MAALTKVINDVKMIKQEEKADESNMQVMKNPVAQDADDYE